jgi:hypothetical protein
MVQETAVTDLLSCLNFMKTIKNDKKEKFKLYLDHINAV